MKRLAIFAGYNSNSEIEPYVIYYLEELNKVADVIFVYDNEFSNKELSKIKNLTIHQICKRHGEYDFGSYKRGYLWAKESGILKDYDSLTFCNDSVYGPFRPLKPIYEDFEKRKNVDFWGVFLFGGEKRFPKRSEFYKAEHLQSYFMVFSSKVFNSTVFDTFISSIKKQKRKKDIVRKYEAGAYNLFTGRGFKCASLFQSYENEPHNGRAIGLIENGFPFLKKCLFDIKREDTKCKDLKYYSDVIRKLNKDYPVDLINKDVMKNFNKEDIILLLNRKVNNFKIDILHDKFLRLKGRYVGKHFKFMIDIFGMTIVKIFIPEMLMTKATGIKKIDGLFD